MMSLEVGVGWGEDQVAQPQAGSMVLFTFIWLCPSHLDITRHHLLLHRSEILYGFSLPLQRFCGAPPGRGLARRLDQLRILHIVFIERG